MTRGALALSILLPACSFRGNGGSGDGGTTADARDGDAGTPDARIDAMPGDPCLLWTFEPNELSPCGIPDPVDANLVEIDSMGWTLDGDTGVLTDGMVSVPLARGSVNGVSVISVADFRITSSGSVRGIGTQPIALVSWSDMLVDGLVDVRSTASAVAPGAGARGSCAQGSQPGTASDGGDGGGGGGAFRGAGGTGGAGENGAGAGGAGGTAQALPAILQGGCPGADSITLGIGTPGLGGAGGGAIMLVARDTLTIASGTVVASGAGGTGGDDGQTGGGGGGSGGMIKLEASTIMVTSSASLAANGGQGGGGCDNNPADPGVDGTEDDTQAFQNNHEGMGSNGGAGGFVDVTDGDPAATAPRGGGGGGGGVGFIVYRGHPTATIDPGATISPSAAPF